MTLGHQHGYCFIARAELKIILGSNIMCWEGAVRSSVILLKALGALAGVHSETSCTASAKSWVEPGRGFCKCSGGFGPSLIPRPLCRGGGGGGWTLLLQQCKHTINPQKAHVCVCGTTLH